MPPRSPQLLEDIRDAAAFIVKVTRGVTLERYAADRMLRQAVERNFESIGKAVKRLSAADPVSAARIGLREQIIAFRKTKRRQRPGVKILRRTCNAPYEVLVLPFPARRARVA
jgi:hypothetical protein